MGLDLSTIRPPVAVSSAPPLSDALKISAVQSVPVFVVWLWWSRRDVWGQLPAFPIELQLVVYASLSPCIPSRTCSVARQKHPPWCSWTTLHWKTLLNLLFAVCLRLQLQLTHSHGSMLVRSVFRWYWGGWWAACWPIVITKMPESYAWLSSHPVQRLVAPRSRCNTLDLPSTLPLRVPYRNHSLHQQNRCIDRMREKMWRVRMFELLLALWVVAWGPSWCSRRVARGRWTAPHWAFRRVLSHLSYLSNYAALL